MDGPAETRDCFLPDFHRLRTLFIVVLTAQLLAFVLVLAQPPGSDLWQALSLYSLFIQWIALPSVLLLGLIRPWLAGRPDWQAGVLAWFAVVAVASVASVAAWHLVLHRAGVPAGEFALRSIGLTALVAAVALRFLQMQRVWERGVEAAASARVAALQARIRPHFLFNALNTIAAQVRTDPAGAEDATADLADLFRASLDARTPLDRLERELALAEGYLRLEALRLGDRLQVDWSLDALPPDALIPPLTLQPLLENAVRHGIEPTPGGGLVRITGGLAGERLCLRVENPLPPAASDAAGFGMAQGNVAERLRLAFGEAARLETACTDGLYRVTLLMPLRREPEEEAP